MKKLYKGLCHLEGPISDKNQIYQNPRWTIALGIFKEQVISRDDANRVGLFLENRCHKNQPITAAIITVYVDKSKKHNSK